MVAIVSGLNGNEIYCLALKGHKAGRAVFGNYVMTRGVWGAFRSLGQNLFGGEVEPVTEVIRKSRDEAFKRMEDAARESGASGVAGVTSALNTEHDRTQFIFNASCIHGPAGAGGSFFSAAGTAGELFCHLDAGFKPIKHVFGNIAYSVGVPGAFRAGIKALSRGEIPEFTGIFQNMRRTALERITEQARKDGANAVVGIQTEITDWDGIAEMSMTGTAARHDGLPSSADQKPVTSDLTGEECWALAKLGYAPKQMLLQTAIYSLGVSGAIGAALKVSKGELTGLTTLVRDARDTVIERLQEEATAIGAEEVVGVKTFIKHWGGYMEVMAVGTAVCLNDKMRVASDALPPQALARDRDTWIEDDVKPLEARLG